MMLVYGIRIIIIFIYFHVMNEFPVYQKTVCSGEQPFVYVYLARERPGGNTFFVLFSFVHQ